MTGKVLCANISPVQITAEEEFLLTQFVSGRPQAVHAIAERFGPSVYGFVLSALGGDSQRAGRIVVNAFAGVLRRVSSTDEKQPPFLIRVLSLACGQIKKEKPSNAPRPVLEEFAGPAISDSYKRRFTVILKALLELPPQERCLLLLRDQMSFSSEEISHVLGLSAAGVKHRLNPVRTLFHQTIEKHIFESGKLK